MSVGVGIGLILAITLAGYVNRVFPDLASIDPVVFGVAAAGLLVAAGAAALLPSVRALRVDPATVLREE